MGRKRVQLPESPRIASPGPVGTLEDRSATAMRDLIDRAKRRATLPEMTSHWERALAASGMFRSEIGDLATGHDEILGRATSSE
ncbi:MAG: hypothetical protein EPO26_14930 [Chloroflexota bacterium]|nr:MAG: hypothetical protein EPO26_14930 [Chloroflexota bacterium]